MIAQLLISSVEPRKVHIEKLLIANGLKISHPDLLQFDSEQKVGIEQARKIKDFFAYKPFQAQGKAVVIENADLITLEAQNALLKTIEELPETAILILGCSSQENLLPTFTSRCQIISLQDSESTLDINEQDKYYKDLSILLAADTAYRFEYIEKLKDREAFLQSLTRFFRQLLIHRRAVLINRESQQDSVALKINSLQIKKFLDEILEAEKWAKQNVNLRGILEYLMLKMPTIK